MSMCTAVSGRPSPHHHLIRRVAPGIPSIDFSRPPIMMRLAQRPLGDSPTPADRAGQAAAWRLAYIDRSCFIPASASEQFQERLRRLLVLVGPIRKRGLWLRVSESPSDGTNDVWDETVHVATFVGHCRIITTAMHDRGAISRARGNYQRTANPR
jgi:hypothetical protein